MKPRESRGAAGLLAAAVFVGSVAGGAASTPVRSDSRTATVTPSRGLVVTARIDVPEPGAMVAAAGMIWVRSAGTTTNVIHEIDPRTNTIASSMHVGSAGDAAMAVGMGSIWVLDGRGTLFRIDPHLGGQVIASVHVAGSGTALAVGDGAVWVACCGPDTRPGRAALYRIDPAIDRVAARFPLPGLPDGVAADGEGLWVTNYVDGVAEVLHLDPRDGRILATIRLSRHVSTADVALSGWVYVTARSGFAGNQGGVFQISPLSNEVTRRIPVPGALMGVAVGTGDVWVNSGPLILVQPFAGDVVASVPVSSPDDTNAGIAMIGRTAWLSDPVDQQVVRVDPKTGGCSPHTGAYTPTLSIAGGAPGAKVTISGQLPAYTENGAYRPRMTDEVEFWWNLAPRAWDSALPGSTPVPDLPGPVIEIGAEGVLGVCGFRVTFTVPSVVRGDFPVVGIYFAGRGAASFPPVSFRVTA